MGKSVSYRVGSHYGIHIYEISEGQGVDEDRPVATASTPEDAERIVYALNTVDGLNAAPQGSAGLTVWGDSWGNVWRGSWRSPEPFGEGRTCTCAGVRGPWCDVHGFAEVGAR